MDAQALAQEAEAVRPYLWEIVSVCGIFVSLTITQWIKKLRFLPKFLCNVKLSKPKRGGIQYQYKQLKAGYLDAIAVLQTFVYVSGSLFIRYQTPEVLIIGFFASVLQWKIIKIIFLNHGYFSCVESVNLPLNILGSSVQKA